MIQKFEAFPDKNLGNCYEHQTSDGHELFLNWLRGLCVDRRNVFNYENYSSFYNWTEEASYVDGLKHYKAYKIFNQILVDDNRNKASTSLTEWLFSDDVYENNLNHNGIATRKEVFRKWNLQKE